MLVPESDPQYVITNMNIVSEADRIVLDTNCGKFEVIAFSLLGDKVLFVNTDRGALQIKRQPGEYFTLLANAFKRVALKQRQYS